MVKFGGKEELRGVGPSRWVNLLFPSFLILGPPFSLVSNAGHQNPCQFYLRAHHNAELIGTGGEIHLNWCCIRSGVAKNLRVGTAARLVIQVLLFPLLSQFTLRRRGRGVIFVRSLATLPGPVRVRYRE